MNIEKILGKAGLSEKKSLDEYEAKHLLRQYNIPVVSEIAAPNQEEAIRAAEDMGFPVVVKGLGEKLLHKTEMGLVHLNLTDAKAVREATEHIADRAGNDLKGFLVQPQIDGKREFLAGMFRDEQFGPVVMFGLGGIFTEALSDVTFRIAPLTEADAAEMLEDIRAKALLDAFRGEQAAIREQLIRTLTGLSRMAEDSPDIAEIDINPLILTAKGDICAVDALVVPGKTLSPDCAAPEQEREKINLPLLGNLFHPKSIAFVGASSQIGKWGHILPCITISRGYEGEIYLVNARGGTIAGREVYKSLDEIPGTVDLAVVTIPAAGIQALIPQFRKKGIRNMLLITSGFSETGEQGRKLEEELVKKAKDADILLLGPNTMGVCNPHISLYCTGSQVWPIAGSTSVVSQSGNMGTQLLAFAEQQGVGIRCFSGSGNEAMITIEDYIEGLELDEKTRIIMLYVESVKDGRRFFESARRVGKKKPIILLKGGRTDVGQKAAASHTGALASDSGLFNAMCRQAGIVNVRYPMEMLDLSAAFSSLPLPKGKRAAIMTLGGGWGVVAADLCAEHSLEVPELPPEIVERMDKILPPYWSKSNPVDIVGERDNTIPMIILEELLKWEGCDAVINLGIMGRSILMGRVGDSVLKADSAYSEEFINSIKGQLAEFEVRYVEHIVSLMEKYDKPVFGVSILTSGKEQTLHRVGDKKLKGVFYPTPERAVKAFAGMYEYQRFLNR